MRNRFIDYFDFLIDRFNRFFEILNGLSDGKIVSLTKNENNNLV